jgi:predicted membrane-bound spermidine synthase
MRVATDPAIQSARELGAIIRKLRVVMSEKDSKLALVQHLERIAFQKTAIEVADMIIADLSDAEVRMLARSYGVEA